MPGALSTSATAGSPRMVIITTSELRGRRDRQGRRDWQNRWGLQGRWGRGGRLNRQNRQNRRDWGSGVTAMDLSETLSTSVEALLLNKVRTALASLGIIIG